MASKYDHIGQLTSKGFSRIEARYLLGVPITNSNKNDAQKSLAAKGMGNLSEGEYKGWSAGDIENKLPNVNLYAQKQDPAEYAADQQMAAALGISPAGGIDPNNQQQFSANYLSQYGGQGGEVDAQGNPIQPQNIDPAAPGYNPAQVNAAGGTPGTVPGQGPQAGSLQPKFLYYDPATGMPTNLAQGAMDIIKRQGTQAQRRVQGQLGARGVGTSGASLRATKGIAQQTKDNLLQQRQAMLGSDRQAQQQYQNLVASYLQGQTAGKEVEEE